MLTVRENPCGLSASTFKALVPHMRALFLAADECDYWKAQEEPHGSNRGPRVDVYLKTAKTDFGQPWCAAFVYWCCVTAGFAPDVKNPASVLSWVDWAKRHGRLIEQPERGCLFAYTKAGHTHIGFVTQVNQNGTFSTIEGNSNDDGSREGYETVRKTRASKADGLVFIRLA